MYGFDFDERTGVLRASATGFWSAEDADRFRDELRVRAVDAKQRSGRLRLLVDGTGSQVQKPEVTNRLATLAADLIQSPDDRIAVVVGSNLIKMQAERILQSDGAQAFLSSAEAKAWLLEGA
jgi:hypothetical protein